MNGKCEILTNKDQFALTIRTRTPAAQLPMILGPSFGEIMSVLGPQVNLAREAFVIYHNMEMNDLDIEIGFTTTEKHPGGGRVQSTTIPGGDKAVVMYTGPYNKVEEAYTELTGFVQASGRQPTGIAIEYYLDPPETPPDKTRTRVVFPLQ